MPFRSTLALLLVAALVIVVPSPSVDACSRATWIGRDGSVITGRSMDWPYDFNTHFYVLSLIHI